MLSGRKEHGRESQKGGGHIDVGGMYVHGEHSHKTIAHRRRLDPGKQMPSNIPACWLPQEDDRQRRMGERE